MVRRTSVAVLLLVVLALAGTETLWARTPNAGIYGTWVNTRTYLLDQPYMAGSQVIVDWRDVENGGEGVYDWKKMDDALHALVLKGLSATVQINGGRKPDWLFDVCPYNSTFTNVQSHDIGILMYWHPVHKRAYLNMLTAFAQHLRESPERDHVIGVRMNYDAIGTESNQIPTGKRDGPNVNPQTTPPNQGWIKPAGCTDWGTWPWTSTLGNNYNKDVMRQYEAEFKKLPKTMVFCRVGSHDTLLTLFPNAFNNGDLGWFTTAAEGAPRESWCITQYNNYKNDCLPGETLGYSESWGDTWGYHNGLAEDYYTITDTIKYRMSPPQENYWRILWDLSVGVSYIAVYGDDLNVAVNATYPTSRTLEPSPYPYRTGSVAVYKDEYIAAYEFGAKYAGYHNDPAGSPGAWIAFRYGQYNMDSAGDYRFLMTRVTSDATTYPAYGNTVGSFDNRQGAFCRYLPDGQSMNLILNSAFVTSLADEDASIATTYLDEGTGTLQVLAGGQTFATTLQNSGQWKTLSGTVKGNALTANAKGAHVELKASGAQITLHMVEVTRKEAVPPLPASFTRKSLWNAANTSDARNSGFNANDNAVSGSMWRYDYVNGGGLAESNAWFKQSGTALVWDATNSDWDSGSFYPQIDSFGPAHTGATAGDYGKIGRVIWRAPYAGKLTLSGTLNVAFFKDAAAKTTEWAIVKRSGTAYAVLASGQQSVVANEAGAAMVTKAVNLTAAAYPGLSDVAVVEGDEVIWTHRLTAQGGSNSVRLKDDAMTLSLVSDDGDSGARSWVGYR